MSHFRFFDCAKRALCDAFIPNYTSETSSDNRTINMPRVLITVSELVFQFGPCQQILVDGGFEIAYPPKGITLHDEDRLIQHLHGIDAALVGSEPLSRRVLESSKLRAIARFGVGYDAVDIAAATERGIAVAITPGANQESVAEHALALILGVMRGFPRRDHGVRNGSWGHREPLAPVRGKTLGLIGLGRIGKEVVPRAQAFGMRVIAYDPQPDCRFADSNKVRLCSLDELLAESDIVSLHLPCTPKTEQIINRGTLAKMRRGAILINTARGGLIDEEALADALTTGQLAGAGLDAFVVEPPPTSSRLLQFENVLLSPHTAGVDLDSARAMACLAAECLVRLYQGKGLSAGCLVNPEIEPDWKWED